MALELKTSIRIEASAKDVWDILTDFDAYPEWNPFVKKIEGEMIIGKKFKAEITNMKFTPRLLAFESNQKLEWIGRLFFPGLFDGRHYFFLQDNGDGSTTLIHGEHFKGLLVPIFKKKLMLETKAGFEALNQALKERVESRISV